jgi:glycosyltransferase involved in cell wall biosynthesis
MTPVPATKVHAMTRVDVIIPCYNYGAMLEACVASVVSQEGVAVRAMIVDDASTDSTEAIGRRLAAADPRVEYCRHEENWGHIPSYNEALSRVTADYCVILSADDLLTPRSLMRVTRVMDAHPEVALAYGRDITFRHVPPATGTFPTVSSHRIMHYTEFLRRSCAQGQTGIQAPTAVVRSSVHQRVGGYLPELPHSGDTEIWLRLAAHGAVVELAADQAYRRLHDRNMSLTYSPLARLREQRRAFDIHFDEYRGSRPEIAAASPVLARTLADSAFWSGVRAFEAGHETLCDEFHAYAIEMDARIRSSRSWWRFQLKRRAGRAAARLIGPLANRQRHATSD